MIKNSVLGILLISSSFFLYSCSEDEGSTVNPVPETYEFTRNGESTVSYQGQIDRLDMLSEMKSYVRHGDAGEVVDATILANMYTNENSPFQDAALNSSTKQLRDKTFLGDQQFFDDLIASVGVASADVAANQTMASQGVSGLISRDPIAGKNILVNEKGWEYTQMLEKGLMGAVFYNQIFNSYLTDAKIGDNIENTALVEGENYTPMEHHWDEAFGYWGVPTDFPDGDPILPEDNDRFWAAYTADRDAFLNVNEPLMNAYLAGRNAIVNKDYVTKNEQRIIIYDQHELVAAATAVHYINTAIDDLLNEDMGNLFHHLSESYGFVKAISYSPNKNLTATEINTILNSNFGTDADFWTVTVVGLEEAKSTIISAYPELDGIADQL